MWGGRIFSKNLRTSLINDLSNEPKFGRFISLDITFKERVCRIVGVLEAVFVFAAVVGVLALSAYLLLA